MTNINEVTPSDAGLEYGKKLVVSNIAQKIIFFAEMEGQISDGNWENALPHGHHEPWMLEWYEIEVGKPVGRNFYAEKSNYSFASAYLLDIVGTRIAYKVRLAMLYPDRILPIIEHNHWVLPEDLSEVQYAFNDLNKGVVTHSSGKAIKLLSINISEEMLITAWNDESYGMKELKADCTLLRKACETFLVE